MEADQEILCVNFITLGCVEGKKKKVNSRLIQKSAGCIGNQSTCVKVVTLAVSIKEKED